jgi:hypothetical protein
MLDIHVSPEQIKYVEDLLQRVNFGRRGDADGDYTMQRTGIIGQVVVCDLLKQPRPKGDGFDKGIDLEIHGMKIDVKTMGRTVPFVRGRGYVHNFMGSQAHFDTQIYLFCSFNMRKNILTICGWLPKVDFFQRSSFFRQGEIRVNHGGKRIAIRRKDGMYEIAGFLINDFISPESFCEEIKHYSNNKKKSA